MKHMVLLPDPLSFSRHFAMVWTVNSFQIIDDQLNHQSLITSVKFHCLDSTVNNYVCMSSFTVCRCLWF
jgi:hypothetical protein